MKKLTVICLLALTSQSSTSSQILFSGSPYLENFDSLAKTGTSIPWSDGSSLPGWYSTRATYAAGTGSGSGGGLYSFGTSGDNDRALGTLATGSVTPIHIGVRLRNDTPTTITKLDLSFMGEQWRVGGASSVNNTLAAAYKLGATTLNESGFTDLPALNFDSAIDAGTAGSVNGNDPNQRRSISGAIESISWLPGQDLWLRWTDSDNSSSDHGLGIDELSISAVPEPGEYGLIAGGMLVIFAWARKRLALET